MTKINKQITTIIILFFFLTTCYLLPATSARADSFSLSVSPPIIKIMIKPGKTISKSIKITNDGDPTVAKVTITPFTPVDSRGAITLIDCQKAKVASCQAIPWFDLTTTYFLKSHQETPINFKIHVPENAGNGDYYVSLLIQGDEPSQTNKTGVALVGRIAAIVLITVSPDGKTDKNGRIASFQVANGLTLPLGQDRLTVIDSFDAIPVELEVENMGKTFFMTGGTLSLASPFLPEIHFPLSSQVILNGATRHLSVPSEKAVASLTNEVNATRYPNTHIFPSSFYLGLTTLKTNIILGDLAQAVSPQGKEGKQPELTGKIMILALPFKLSILVTFLSLVMIVIKYSRKKSIGLH